MASIDFQAAAYAEYLEALRFYAARAPALARRFQMSFDAAVDQIAQHPARWPLVVEDIRRVQVQRFPYLVFYYRVSTELIRVLAVVHSSRRPLYWLKRR